MNIDSFFSFFNGIYCDFDGADGDQCFDLANNYSRWIGGPRFTGATADLIINQAGTFYTRIDNTPTGVPQKGDVVVWSWPHVGIATGNNSNENQFEVLEQNDPANSNCHIKTYPNYNGVLGWLRPITLPQGTDQSTIDTLRSERDNNWNLYQTELTKNNDLTKQITDLQTQLQNLREAFDAQTKADADTGAQLLDAQHKNNDYSQILQALGATDLTSALKAIDQLKTASDDISQHATKVLVPMAETATTKKPMKLSLWQKFLSYFLV